MIESWNDPEGSSSKRDIKKKKYFKVILYLAPRDGVRRKQAKHCFAPLNGFTREGKSRVPGEIGMIEPWNDPEGGSSKRDIKKKKYFKVILYLAPRDGLEPPT